jgi:3-deoxy-D-arabino-heptulosonate 7-phosphate (DAHP) synthase
MSAAMPVEDPEPALCDGPEQLHAADFPAFAAEVAAHAQLAGRSLASRQHRR